LRFKKSNQPKDLGEGLKMGAKDFGRGFYDAITGLVKQPYNGAKKDGVRGFGVGMLKGLAGCIVKVSVLDFWIFFFLPSFALFCSFFFFH
jgi:hypothetical protein